MVAVARLRWLRGNSCADAQLAAAMSTAACAVNGQGQWACYAVGCVCRGVGVGGVGSVLPMLMQHNNFDYMQGVCRWVCHRVCYTEYADM